MTSKQVPCALSSVSATVKYFVFFAENVSGIVFIGASSCAVTMYFTGGFWVLTLCSTISVTSLVRGLICGFLEIFHFETSVSSANGDAVISSFPPAGFFYLSPCPGARAPSPVSRLNRGDAFPLLWVPRETRSAGHMLSRAHALVGI